MLNGYDGTEPFVHFSRKFFAANKKYGSRDRKSIAALCYSYFRTFHLFKNEPLDQSVLYAVFLCEPAHSDFLRELHPSLHENITLSTEDKLKLLGRTYESIFPDLSEISVTLNKADFAISFLRQPLLYLRIRPGKQQQVINKLTENELPFEQIATDCVALKNATSMETILKINREVVVQDFSSQRVFDFLAKEPGSREQKRISAWDCCAASGGKSILLYDRTAGMVQLTVSDIRKSILHNLQERLQAAGVPIYKALVADLMKGAPAEVEERFDIVVCDAPCTGSGTWSRTPEQMAFFKTGKIVEYAARQLSIAGNAVSLLKNGGMFFYITCSVFAKENEEVVSKLQEQHSLKLLHQQYHEGYQMQADTLFVAVLSR